MSKIKRVIIVICLCLYGGLLFGSHQVNASKMTIADSESIKQKAYYAGVLRCFELDKVEGGLINRIKLGDFNGVKSLVETAPEQDKVLKIGESNEKMSCRELLTTKTAKKIPEVVDGNMEEKKSVLSNSGYGEDVSNDTASDDGFVCAQFPIVVEGNGSSKIEYTSQLCVKINGGSVDFDIRGSGLTLGPKFYEASKNKLTISVPKKNRNNLDYADDYTLDFSGITDAYSALKDVGNKIANTFGDGEQRADGKIFKDSEGKLYYAACGEYSMGNGLICTKTTYGDNPGQFNLGQGTSADTYYKKKQSKDDIVNLFSDSSFKNKDSIKYDDDEQYKLYYYYLENVYGLTDLKCSDSAGDDGGRDYTTKLWWSEKGKYSSYCSFNVNKDKKDTKVNGVHTDSKLFGQPMKLSQIVDILKGLNPTDQPVEVVEELENPDGSGENKCRDGGGAKALGWIICPILEVIGEATQKIYDDVVEPSLNMEPTLFSGVNSSLYNAWDSFRNIANVVFVIMLLVVIISQVTGVGIDNYGIKRILPKLIVAAILINLSYVICILCVDLSNIFGSGIQDVFNAISVSPGAANIEGTSVVPTMTSLVGAGLLVGILGATGSFWATPAILLSLLIAGIGVVISIFFMFILLAARKAGVVVLVAVAPLAVVCYMLPNTKKIFDRWLKMMAGLLLLYPICGLLVGGGNYVSSLLLATGAGGGLFTAFTAMVAGVLPIFFIPTVLRHSFSAMGNIGNAIAGFGQRMSSGFTRTARNSEAYKGAQEGLSRWRTRQQAGIGADGKARTMGRFGRFIRGGDRRMAESRARYRKDQMEQGERSDLMNETVYNARLKSDSESQRLKSFQEQYNNMTANDLVKEAKNSGSWLGGAEPDAQRAAALFSALESQGKQDSIYEMLRNNENIGKNEAIMKALAGSNDKVLSAYGKKGGGESYQKFMQEGGMRDYLNSQGGDFVKGLDDNSLKEISANDAQSVAAGYGHIMSTSQLVQAASQLNDEKSMKEINTMMEGRDDFSVSGEQLANFNDSTIETLSKNQNASSAVAKAMEDLANNQQLASKIDKDKQKRMMGMMNNEDLRAVVNNPNLAGNNSFKLRAAEEYHRRVQPINLS